MKTFLTTKAGKLRLLGFSEGISLLALLFIGMPAKYLFGSPEISRILGSVHGALFVLFVLNTLGMSLEQGWSFRSVTWKILLAGLIPFGTFYTDRTFFKNLNSRKL